MPKSFIKSRPFVPEYSITQKEILVNVAGAMKPAAFAGKCKNGEKDAKMFKKCKICGICLDFQKKKYKTYGQSVKFVV